MSGAFPLFLEDPSIVDRLSDAFRKHASRSIAAAKGGISPSTLNTWIFRGQAGEDPYTIVWERLREAITDSRQTLLARISEAVDRQGQPDPKWAAWLLERLERVDYGTGTLSLPDAEPTTAAGKLEQLSKARIQLEDAILSAETDKDRDRYTTLLGIVSESISRVSQSLDGHDR